MTQVLWALAITLIVSFAIQFVLVHGFVRSLRAWRRELLADDDCPPAAVILCLRGGDPFLSRCIDGLMNQDYPRYRVYFMVDHAEDPAMAVLQQALLNHTGKDYEIQVLREPLSTCSLKCSSLVQAVKSLPESTQFIASIDADTIAHSSWLRELATALAPEAVGAATGNRWYMPAELTQGSLVRYVWNAAAVVQMYWYRIAWGGTLAIKTSSIQRAGLVERWSNAFCEDTMLRQQLRPIGERVEFVPSLMMINREECTIGSFFSWVQRQLLTAKLYHPLWLAVVGHGISSAALLIWGWGLGLYLIAAQDAWTGLAVLIAMLVFQVSLSLLLPWMESAIQSMVQARGEPADWNRKLSSTRFAWSVWLTQWVYTWALVTCLFIRRVHWRGVEYDVHGSWKIRLLSYRPYRAEESVGPEEPGNVSLQSL